jgi:hypothetical protein
MLPRRERHGRTINPSSIPTDWSSSKPAPQPKWRGCVAGLHAANGRSAKSRTGTGKPLPLLRGLRSTALTAPCVIDGLMNGNAFLAYVEQVLALTLKPADVIVLGNLSAHKVPGIREAGSSNQTLHRCVFLYARRHSNAGLPDHQPLSSRARGARWHCWTVPAPRPSGKCSGSCNAQPRRRIQSFRP